MVITQPALIYPNPLAVIPIEVVRIPLPAWNMTTTADIFVSSNIRYDKILSIQAVIRSDDEQDNSVIPNSDGAARNYSSWLAIGFSGDIRLNRGSSSFYATSGFYVGTGFSRGLITILKDARP